MEKNITKLYITIVSMAIMLIIYAYIKGNVAIEEPKISSSLTILQDQWEKSEQEGEIIYRHQLVEEDMNDKVIAFYTSHRIVHAYLDDKLIYSATPMNDIKIKTTGYSWHYIPLQNRDQGKTLFIRVSPIYNNKIESPVLYYGTKSDVLVWNMNRYLFNYMNSVILMFLGFAICLYIIFNNREKSVQKSLFYLALFSALLGLWRWGEIPLTALFIKNPIKLTFITHTALMMMPLSFYLFIKNAYNRHDFKWADEIILGSCLVILFRLGMQMFGILDLRETLSLTHLNILLVVIPICIRILSRFIRGKYQKEEIFHYVMLLLIILVTSVSLMIYRHKGANSDSGIVMFLVYVVSVAIGTMKSLKSIDSRAKELKIYQELAYKDSLTETLNRTAFQETIKAHMTKEKAHGVAIMMIDLNNLKKCNDRYGHQLGDEYLTMVAKVIHLVFSQLGNIYRVGGDEFCILVKEADTHTLIKKVDEFENCMQEINEKGFVVQASAAIGYSVFDEALDENILDTKHRADQMMYICKRKQKGQKEGG